MPNRLGDTASTYLQLHAHQKINWWPWCEEAWAEARERNVPVFISVGYASCHWCHVMSEESFDDAVIASILNKDWVAIKVDREQHPDVDAVFMAATQALTGRGGWPNSVFCTPEGKPFFAGTYYPRKAEGGMPGFDQVLTSLAQAWADRHDEVIDSAQQITEQLVTMQQPQTPITVDLSAIRQRVAESSDGIHGGWGNAPKFPHAATIDGLLISGDAGELSMAHHALEAMARGGIHDQLGGGFHRYAVDHAWVTPHFEKMLYDNALLLGVYARGWRRTPDHDTWLRGFFAGVVESLIGWLQREMRTDEGLYASAQDADSADIRGFAHEGAYYLWNLELLDDALGVEDAEWASRVFHVTKPGTFEGGFSTLQLRAHPDPERLAKVRQTLFDLRWNRFPPQRDSMIVACWNGLLLDSLTQAALIFGREDWLGYARELADALWQIHVKDGAVARTSFQGVTATAGQCEDYAALALGFARFGATVGERVWAERAGELLAQASAHFGADDGGFFDGPATDLLYVRPRDVADIDVPSATSIMVCAQRLVGLLLDDADLLAQADRAAATTSVFFAQSPVNAGWALAEAMISDEARRGLGRATIVVERTEGVLDQMAIATYRMAPAGSAIINVAPGQQWGALTQNRDARDGKSTVYVCRGTQCFEPVTELADLKEPLWARC